MKWLLLLLISAAAHADPQVCSKYMSGDPEMVKAIEFLKRYEGRYKFGGCQIELHVCDSFSDQDDRGDMAGDLLLVDKLNREFYVPLYFLKDQSDKLWFELINGKFVVNYKYEDRTDNPNTYGIESIEFEMYTYWNSTKLKHIEVGYYLRKDYEQNDHENKYQWANCDE